VLPPQFIDASQHQPHQVQGHKDLTLAFIP